MLPLLLIASLASAADLQFGYPNHLEGGDKPGLFITPPRAVGELDVECTQGDQVFHWNEQGLPGGATKKFFWERDPAHPSAECVIQARFADDTAEGIVLNLDFTYGASMSVDLGSASVDLDAMTVSIDVTAPVDRAELVAYGAGKEILSQREVGLGGGPGRVDIPWVGDPSEVVILEIKLWSGSSWAGFTYSPWFLDIPHEDVIFDTNSDRIGEDQEHKLQRTLTQLQEVVEKYGDLVPVKLYIAGCTDTVGSHAHNAELSRRRARSIGHWLRQHGFTYPVYYHGFGEQLLAVPTGDEVEESRNRRALYLVSSNPPPAGSGIPSAGWSAL
jgi:outer membrane protein OmpA-like peptidoglycan-associated protein